MEQDKIIIALQKCKEFRNLEIDELETLISIGSIEVFRKGEGVFTIDHEGKNFFVVIEGRLTLRLKSNMSKEYKSGELFGEVAILGDTLRFGTIHATEASTLIAFNRDKLFNSAVVPKDLLLKITLALTKKIISYFDHDTLVCSEKLIEKGECDYIEFKKSIHKYNKKVIVKTLASFMNLNGGTIFCGIHDESNEITGLNINQKDFDEIQKMINVEVRKKLGLNFLKYITYDFEKIKDKKIIRIDCGSSNIPVFYKKNDGNGKELEYFVVRSGSENITIKKTSEIVKYVQDRFKKK